MITTIITARQRLTDADIRAMFALHLRYFAGTCEEKFRRDLAEKDWVITLRDSGTLAGFSTQKLIPLTIQGRLCRFLFSGDTVVDQPYWNQQGLSGGWGHLAMKLAAEHGSRDLYWFLICKGFRTYRFLSTFFRRYCPMATDVTGNDTLRPLLDAVAATRYGTAYDAASGVIRSAGQGDRLADDWAAIAPHRLTDPHVSFFLAANPGWRNGDELACLAPINHENLNHLGHRVIRTTAVAWHET